MVIEEKDNIWDNLIWRTSVCQNRLLVIIEKTKILRACESVTSVTQQDRPVCICYNTVFLYFRNWSPANEIQTSITSSLDKKQDQNNSILSSRSHVDVLTMSSEELNTSIPEDISRTIEHVGEGQPHRSCESSYRTVSQIMPWYLPF